MVTWTDRQRLDDHNGLTLPSIESKANLWFVESYCRKKMMKKFSITINQIC